MCKQPSCTGLLYTCLVFTLILLTLFLVLAVCVTVSFVNRETPTRTDPQSRATPSILQIQVLGGSAGSVHDVVVNPEKNPWVDDLVKALHGVVEFYAIDPAIRADVKQHLKCVGGERLSVSGLIRFQGGRYSLDGAAKDMIDTFMYQVGDSATKWGVFGFASESGEKEGNQKLSWQRACAAKEHICNHDADPSLCKLDCETYPEDRSGQAATGLQCLPAEGDEKTDPLICFLGEQHFINGVADSRSVVIAACRTEE